MPRRADGGSGAVHFPDVSPRRGEYGVAGRGARVPTNFSFDTGLPRSSKLDRTPLALASSGGPPKWGQIPRWDTNPL